MKNLIRLIAVAGAVASPAFAQDASTEAGATLDAMTCRDFVELAPEDQMAVMLAMRAHVNGDPLPDEPLPLGMQAEVGGADGPGGDSGGAGAAAAGAGEAAEEVTEVEDTAAAAAGEPSPAALTAESLTETPSDPKLTAMRTSCLGGPDALASDAMRAAHADYE